jgi:23S rRNA (adenine2030-N6)-methyltransferase
MDSMNYRHIYHAGNFADVLKHTALTAILLHLRKKEKAFAVIDSHAGRGLYDIAGPEAAKTAEAKNGILRLLDTDALPGVLQAYGEIVRGFGTGHYPGSPLIAAKLLRPQDRLTAIEMQPDECAALASALAKTPPAHAIEGDGYKELPRLLPPPERRGVVLIDPPFETDGEFLAAARALVDAHRRFATGIYLFWHPLKERASADATIGEILNAGVGDALRIELDVDAFSARARENQGPALSATGMLIINAPYGFEGEMGVILPFLAETLAQGPRAHFRLERLAGEAA